MNKSTKFILLIKIPFKEPYFSKPNPSIHKYFSVILLNLPKLTLLFAIN